MRVLITGGTGSFGQAYLRYLNRTTNDVVVVFSRDEQKHYQLQRRQDLDHSKIRYFVGDVRDQSRLREALNGVDVVIHAAAMKHVPICEYNPQEAIETNVFGTLNLCRVAIQAGVQQVLLVSTDKAVCPINLYGTTKLAAERVALASNHLSGDGGTRFSAVRYGNVMGSAGSVLPLWDSQAQTGVLTVTHRDMTRFFILMRDAVQLVTRALLDMQGGEVFVPKLNAVSMYELANAMHPGCAINFVGTRPGEKLHEVLMDESEVPRAYDVGWAYKILPSYDHLQGRETPRQKVDADFVYSSNASQFRLRGRELLDIVMQYRAGSEVTSG